MSKWNGSNYYFHAFFVKITPEWRRIESRKQWKIPFIEGKDKPMFCSIARAVACTSVVLSLEFII
jgi:hypothetical protein